MKKAVINETVIATPMPLHTFPWAHAYPRIISAKIVPPTRQTSVHFEASLHAKCHIC